jgi:hypothetical protein
MRNIYSNKSNELTKGLLGLIFLLIFQFSGFSQNAGISPTGATAPDASAGLDVNFPTKGLLIPRIPLTATSSFLPLTSHVAGMVIYNTATAGDVTPGFYFNNGTRWVPSLPRADAAGEMQYWDGTKWLTIPTGQPGQLLQINSNGIPSWTGAGFASVATSGLSDGGSAVTARGVCWATTPNPTIAGSKTSDGTGLGAFTSNISGLTTGTLYYIRSYATNSLTGTSYGNQLVFMTL